jgi:hypothetical protein
MRESLIAATLLVIGGFAQVGTAEARPAEKTMIKVPFAFSIGNQVLPAGQYQIEMLTESKVGADAVEIIAFRGRDTHAYASFVAYLESGNAGSARLTFRHDEDGSALTKIQVSGKTYRIAPSRFAKETIENAGLYQTITAEDAVLWQLGR